MRFYLLIFIVSVCNTVNALSIKADQVTIKKYTLTASGNVLLRHDGAILTTEHLYIILDDNKEIVKVILPGLFKAMIRENYILRAEFAELDNLKHTLFLKNNVIISDGINITTCSEIEYKNLKPIKHFRL